MNSNMLISSVHSWVEFQQYDTDTKVTVAIRAISAIAPRDSQSTYVYIDDGEGTHWVVQGSYQETCDLIASRYLSGR